MTHRNECYLADCGAHHPLAGVCMYVRTCTCTCNHLEGPNQRSKGSQRCGDTLTPGQREIHECRDMMEHEKDETAQVESLHRATRETRETREGVEIDHAAEKKLVRKLDLNIIPIVMLLYLFSFLDRQVYLSIDSSLMRGLAGEKLMIRRVNIGNARLYGMEEDLGLVRNQYQTAVSLLFVTYLLSEVPSNLVLKKFTPSRWIAFITIVWSFIDFRMMLKILIVSSSHGLSLQH